jgi:hypothetical protein
VRLLAGTLFGFIIAAVIGLGATWLSLTSNAHFGALTIGGWTAYPRSGTADADPYTRAFIARTGLLPIGLGDGVSFTARHDDSGEPLDGRCAIAVSGITPAARFWTLTLYNTDGNLVANSLNRYSFTSQEVLRRDDGSFAITIAPRASTGNWLPTGGVERYLLVLRLYDTPVGVATRAGHEAPMPQITTRACP